MREYRKGSHSKFAIEIHLVWCTKYRKPILRGDVAVRFRAIARQECSELKVEVLSGVVAKDHVHMLVSIPPQVAVSKLVQQLKGKSSYKLQREFKSLQREYWGQKMWSRGYFACSTGNVSSEMIAAYIEDHVDEDDSFQVVDELEN
jgi:putative transposase